MWGEKEKNKKEVGFGQEFYTFLGKGVDFKGKAKFEGTVRVDGNFEGEIIIDDTLIIGENALIKGTITGGTIVSSGRIEGVITANKKNSTPQTSYPHWRCAYTHVCRGRRSLFPGGM